MTTVAHAVDYVCAGCAGPVTWLTEPVDAEGDVHVLVAVGCEPCGTLPTSRETVPT